MSSSNSITSLSDIQERQLEIKQELEDSKKAAVQSLKTTSDEAQTVVLRDVVLPVVGVALASYLTIKAFRYIVASEDNASTSQVRPQAAAPVQPRQERTITSARSKPVTLRKPFYQSLFQLGALLVPAGQAIMDVIKEERK